MVCDLNSELFLNTDKNHIIALLNVEKHFDFDGSQFIFAYELARSVTNGNHFSSLVISNEF